jgi:hypothetical protein
MEYETMNDRIVTPEFRLAFAALFAPAVNRQNPNGVAKYGCTLLIPKTTDISSLRAIMLKCAKEEYGEDLAGLKGAKLENPIKDGDQKPEWPGFPGNWYIRTVTQIQPAVFDQACKEVKPVEQKRVYAGCYCKAQVHCFAWKHSGKIGVSFGVDAVQLVRDGEPFVGVVDAEKVFGVVPGAAAGPSNPANYKQPAPATNDPFA